MKKSVLYNIRSSYVVREGDKSNYYVGEDLKFINYMQMRKIVRKLKSKKYFNGLPIENMVIKITLVI